jgi:homoserine kinase
MATKKKTIRVFAPATVANLACGFDIMGLAIDEPGDIVEITPNKSGDLFITKITGDGKKLSRNPFENTVTVSIAAFLQHSGLKQGFDIVLHKQMPLGSGLGSSAASSAAGVKAVNEFFGKPLKTKELVKFAMEGERVACGSAHADNVAPCLLGGIVLCHPSGELVELPVPAGMHLVVVHPQVEVLTRDSRAVLPKQIALSTGIQQWANTAALTSSLYTGDYDLMRLALQDLVAEPNRGKLIPYFTDIKSAAMQHAIGCSISGSGPSVFAIAKGLPAAKQTAKAMEAVCKKFKLRCTVYVSKVNRSGAKVLR